MNKKELEESPYCEVCGTCGEIGCCGIRNFISEHIEGKTNCKNEGWIIQDLINLCEYKDEVFKENKRLNNIINELEKWLETKREEYATNIEWLSTTRMSNVLDKLKELKEEGNKDE